MSTGPRDGGVWLLGLLQLAAVPARLLLAQSFVSGEVRRGTPGLVYLYGAGMAGGLVLELLHDKRHVVELPSIARSDADSPTEANSIARPGPNGTSASCPDSSSAGSLAWRWSP